MSTFFVVSNAALWILTLGVVFLLVGTLRSMEYLKWQFEELEATRPARKGRAGLPPSKTAPDFVLPSAAGDEVSLRDFRGREVLLVFTQSGCSPCEDIVPELNRLQAKDKYQVLAVNNSGVHDTRRWAAAVHAQFPVLSQENWSLSKRYEVFATPFAFVIDEHGTIVSKGIVGKPQYLDFVLASASSQKMNNEQVEIAPALESSSSASNLSKEKTHV